MIFHVFMFGNDKARVDQTSSICIKKHETQISYPTFIHSEIFARVTGLIPGILPKQILVQVI